MKMHITETWLQPDVWQRVVDGELGRAELRELVTACDQHPELWKRCAVAFLEEQTLQLELRKLAARWPATPSDALDRQCSVSQPSRLLAVEATGLDETPSAHKHARASATVRRAGSLGSAHSHWLSHLGFAASVALAFLIGWQASQRFGGEQQQHWVSEVNETGADGNSSLIEQVTPSAITEASASTVRDAHAADVGSADSALVDASPEEVVADAIEQALQRPEQFVPLEREIPKQLAELEQRGWVQIESIEGFVPVRLGNGNTAVVPVQQIDLRPVRRTY